MRRFEARIFVVSLPFLLQAFSKAAMGRFGSGWAWLGVTPQAALSILLFWWTQVYMIVPRPFFFSIVCLQGSLAVTSTANQVGAMTIRYLPLELCSYVTLA